MKNIKLYEESLNETRSQVILNDDLIRCASEGMIDDPKKAEELLMAGANPNFKTEVMHLTPLHYTAMRGKPLTAKVLIDAGAEIDAETTEPSMTPLYMAVTYFHANTAKVLINAGANVSKAFKNADEALEFFNGDVSWVTGKNAILFQRFKKTKGLFNR